MSPLHRFSFIGKCLYLSGLVPEPMTCMDDVKLPDFGVGFTNIVGRTTRGSADLKRWATIPRYYYWLEFIILVRMWRKTLSVKRNLWLGKKLHGGSGRFCPQNAKKRALENKKRAPENCHRLQCKSLFSVADLVYGMWKVAPENKN